MGMAVVCERWAGDGDRLLYWTRVLLLTIAAFLSHLGLRLLNRGSLRAQSPQSASWFSRYGILSPTDSNRPGHLVILLSHAHRLPLFFCLFTQVHLLIDGSVEGQYITLSLKLQWKTISYRCIYPTPHQGKNVAQGRF